MALNAAEAAMEISRFAARPLDRSLDQFKSFIEALHELRSDMIMFYRPLGIGHPLGEA